MSKLGITGHRRLDEPLGKLAQRVKDILEEIDPTEVNIGGAKGFDMMIMCVCYLLGIPYTLYLPYKGFVSNDYVMGGISYIQLLNRAVEVIYEADEYTNRSIYMSRNRKIVDNSDSLLTYWNGGDKGGTYNTLKYNRKTGKPVINCYKKNKNDF